MPNGSYNNTLDDVLSSFGAEITWMAKNKTNPDGWDYVSLYCSTSKMNSSTFDDAVLECYLKKIKIGIAWSAPSQIDDVIAYNARQTDERKKITFMTTELETYGSTPNCTVANYRTWIKDNYSKMKAAGLKSYVYEGWNYNYDVTVPYSDGFLLHAYRTTAQMNTKDDMYKYMAGSNNDKRMAMIAAEGKKVGKIVEVSVLTSCEPSFGLDYYKVHEWNDAYDAVKESFSRLASADMKQWLILDGAFVFTSRFMQQAKP